MNSEGIPNSGSYRVRRADLESEGRLVQDLWCRNLSGVDTVRAERKYVTQYLENPAGSADCFLLQKGSSPGLIVGTQSLIRRRFCAFGKPLEGAILADLAVDRAHRSLGPALRLLRACMASARLTDLLLYTFPNQRSEALFKRLGLSPLIELTTYVQLLRVDAWMQRSPGAGLPQLQSMLSPSAGRLLAAGRLRRRLMGGWSQRFEWQEVLGSGELVDRAWHVADRDRLIIGARSFSFLESRFPAWEKIRVTVAVDKPSREPAGMIAWSAVGGTVDIKDIFVTKPFKDFLPVLGSFVDQRASESFERVQLEFFGPHALVTSIRKAGFQPRSRVPVYFLPSQPEPPPSLLSSESPIRSLYLTAFDRDAT